MLLTAVHIDDSEVTKDSVISHVSSSTFTKTKQRRKSKWVDAIQFQISFRELHPTPYVQLWLHNRYNMTFI